MRTILFSVIAYLAALMACAPAAGDDKKPLVGPPAPPAELKIVRSLGPQKEPGAFAFSPDGRVVATAEGKRVRFWDPRTGKEARDPWEPEQTKGLESGDLFFLAFVDAKTVALSFASNRVLQLRSYPDGKEVARLDAGKQSVFLHTVAEGLIAAASAPSPARVRVWANPKGHWVEAWQADVPAGPIKRHPDAPLSLAFSPDRSELAVGTDYGHVYVYRVKDGELRRSADPKKLALSHANVAYSPDGRELAVASGSFREVEEPKYVLGLWDAGLKAPRARLRWGALAREEPAHAYRCFFTPDGKTLVVPCANRTVRFYEAQTGGLRHVGRTPAAPDALTFTPGGRLLAEWAKGADGWSLGLFDWRASARPRPLDAEALGNMWELLGSPDSAKGFRAVVALGAAPTQAARLFGAKLKVVAGPDAAAVKGWVAGLGSEDFVTREAAEKELARLGDAVEAELREAAKSDNPERRDRANRLLKATARRDAPERLRVLRAVEVLEYADTPAGRDVLKALAAGAPSALLTHDAKAALARLEALDSKNP